MTALSEGNDEELKNIHSNQIMEQYKLEYYLYALVQEEIAKPKQNISADNNLENELANSKRHELFLRSNLRGELVMLGSANLPPQEVYETTSALLHRHDKEVSLVRGYQQGLENFIKFSNQPFISNSHLDDLKNNGMTLLAIEYENTLKKIQSLSQAFNENLAMINQKFPDPNDRKEVASKTLMTYIHEMNNTSNKLQKYMFLINKCIEGDVNFLQQHSVGIDNNIQAVQQLVKNIDSTLSDLNEKKHHHK